MLPNYQSVQYLVILQSFLVTFPQQNMAIENIDFQYHKVTVHSERKQSSNKGRCLLFFMMKIFILDFINQYLIEKRTFLYFLQ